MAIAAARHRTFACPHATAAAELACRLVEGRDVLDAARARAAQSLTRTSRRPAGARACTMLAVDALHSALAAAVEQGRLAAVPGRIVVAMSGGVDSAVALTKAMGAGMAPVGVTLRLWVDPRRPTASGRAALHRPCGPRARPAMRSACPISRSTSARASGGRSSTTS